MRFHIFCLHIRKNRFNSGNLFAALAFLRQLDSNSSRMKKRIHSVADREAPGPAYAVRAVLMLTGFSAVLGQIVLMMRTHARLLCLSFGEDLGIRQFRKHAGWYLTGLPVGPVVRRSLGQASSLTQVDGLLDGLDPTLQFPPGASRTARGHTNGPRPVRLPSGWLDDVDDLIPPRGGDVLASGG